jgi:hypothetical protein
MPTYRDPSTEKLSDGRSVADLIRGGNRGLRGVIVSKAGPGGAPVNFDPHDLSRVEINVEPDNPNGMKFNMTQLNKQNVRAAIEAAHQKISGNDIDSVRERVAVTFEELAKMQKSGVRAEQRPTPPPVPKLQPAEPTEDDIIAELEQEVQITTQPPIDKIDRNYSPLEAFGFKKRSQAVPAGFAPKTATTAKVGAPQKLVYFEKEGIGTVPAFFHDIIVATSPENDDSIEESGFMVLIYDLRFEQNAARWFPPANDPYGRPWAVQIHDDSRLYLVHTTGFQYVYDSREYCVLTVERAVVASGV